MEEIINGYLNDFTRKVNSKIVKLSLDSNVQDVAIVFDTENKFIDLYNKRKLKIKFWKEALKNWINDIENNIRNNEINKDDLIQINVFSDAYKDVLLSNNSRLIKYKKELISILTTEAPNVETQLLYIFLTEMANGFIYAHKLPELKKELKLLESENPTNLYPIEEKYTPEIHFDYTTLFLENSFDLINLLKTNGEKDNQFEEIKILLEISKILEPTLTNFLKVFNEIKNKLLELNSPQDNKYKLLILVETKKIEEQITIYEQNKIESNYKGEIWYLGVNFNDIKTNEDALNLVPIYLNDKVKEIKDQIEQIRILFETLTPTNPNNIEAVGTEIPAIELESIKPKLIVLDELGIITHLNDKFQSNKSLIAKIIGLIINEKESSIRPLLSYLGSNGKGNPNHKIYVPTPIKAAITSLNSIGVDVNELMKRL